MDERKIWGKSCASIPADGPEKTLNFPLTVVIPTEGIFEDDLTGGEEQAYLSPVGKYVEVEGAGHVDMIFAEKYARIVANETLEILAGL